MSEATGTYDSSYFINEIEVDDSWQKDLPDEYFEYRKLWDAATNDRVLFDFPLFLEVQMLTACNYACPYCPTVILDSQDPKLRLPDDMVQQVIDECAKEGLPSITFDHGSEPTIDKRLPDHIRRFKEAGVIDIFVHTNGSLLTPELSRELIEGGLTKINISLDAVTEETYKKVRVGGKYDRVIENVENFLEIKKELGKSYPRTRVSFVVDKENVEEKKDFFEFWKDKVNVITFQDQRDYKAMFQEGGAVAPTINQSFKCSQLWQLMVIGTEGDLLPCLQDYKHDYHLGNLKSVSIKEAWNSERANELRNIHSSGNYHELPKCATCVDCASVS